MDNKSENLKMIKGGYDKALYDIKEMGVEWTKKTFSLLLTSVGNNPWFVVGYGKAIVQNEKKEVG